MRMILVSVNYSDLLSLTLPRNRHHFEEVMIVTSWEDEATLRVAYVNNCRTYQTDAFTRDGASFNKWLALEEGLSNFGRWGWLALMDADIVLPAQIPMGNLSVGQLLTPLRHDLTDFSGTIPPENEWGTIPLHSNQSEWAGYCQVFHASDPYLGPPPWHELDWQHAGGADSFFQLKWPRAFKVRPPWYCLHLGPSGQNWYGRATPLIDGTVLPGSAERLQAVANIWTGRRANKAAGRDQFEGEKIG